MSLHARGRRDEGRLPELAERLGVDLGRRLQQCSHGMRQQVAIVAALAHDPALIILDEPTAGLDPLVKAALWALLAEERARGKTVFLSSHVLSEVQAICDRVGIIREGRLVALEQVSHLRQHRLKRIEADFSAEPPDLSGLPGVREPVVRGHHLSLQVQGDVRPVLAALSSAELHDIEVFDPTLEEVFLQFYTAAEGGPRQ
jgi:ABC-2 type transport system ATP-binding protein